MPGNEHVDFTRETLRGTGRVKTWHRAPSRSHNHELRHTALGMISPVDYGRSLAGKDAA
jgi:hypothetical protein